jgi:acyl-coenzyme A thioesterase PaaI-like protein
MARHRLHNEDWGFETNCFVCEPTNAQGLRIPFFHDDEFDIVAADFELTDAFSGAPTLVHGGVTLAVMDEAMAWACIAIGRQWAVTTETTTRFHRTVRVGSRYRVEARVVDHVDDVMSASARLFDGRDQLRVESSATFTTLGEAQAARFAGVEVSDANRTFLRGG